MRRESKTRKEEEKRERKKRSMGRSKQGTRINLEKKEVNTPPHLKTRAHRLILHDNMSNTLKIPSFLVLACILTGRVLQFYQMLLQLIRLGDMNNGESKGGKQLVKQKRRPERVSKVDMERVRERERGRGRERETD